jgi:hypothetical protein
MKIRSTKPRLALEARLWTLSTVSPGHLIVILFGPTFYRTIEMKSGKILASVLAASLMLSGCGAPLDTGKKEYPTVGLFTWNERSKDVCYSVSVGNTIWSIILVETIVAPVYFVGWSIMNPERMKRSPTDDCSIDGK